MPIHNFTLGYVSPGVANLDIEIPETDTNNLFTDTIEGITVIPVPLVSTDLVEETIRRNVFISTESLGQETNPHATVNMVEINTSLLSVGSAMSLSMHSRNVSGTTAIGLDAGMFPNFRANGGSTRYYPVLKGGTNSAPSINSTVRPVFEPPTVLNSLSTDKRILRVEMNAANFFEIETGVLPSSNTVDFILGSLVLPSVNNSIWVSVGERSLQQWQPEGERVGYCYCYVGDNNRWQHCNHISYT